MNEAQTQGQEAQSRTNDNNQTNAPQTQSVRAGGTTESSRALQRSKGSSSIQRRDDFPFSFAQRFMRDMDRLFEDFGFGAGMLSPFFQAEGASAALWAPRLDVSQREGELLVHVDLPGLRQDDIQVQVDNGALTISGERVDEHQREERGVHRRERSYGSFRRSVMLPESVDPASIQARFENGVLEVTIPLPQEEQSEARRIPVQAASAQSENRASENKPS